MTNNPITTARVLHYKPRNTNYRVLHRNVKIKSSDGSWELGCVYTKDFKGNSYTSIGDIQIYTRPYEMFDMDKWETIS